MPEKKVKALPAHGDPLYRKIGRRYYPIGNEFTGFPANGYWKVEGGRQAMLVKLEHPRPLEALRYQRYRDLVLSDFQNQLRLPPDQQGTGFSRQTHRPWSMHELVEFVLEWMAKKRNVSIGD